jgi:hypothetical protein
MLQKLKKKKKKKKDQKMDPSFMPFCTFWHTHTQKKYILQQDWKGVFFGVH